MASKQEKIYEVNLVSQADKRFSKLSGQVRKEVLVVLGELETAPTHNASVYRHAKPTTWKTRQGQARIIFRIDKKKKVVTVLEIALRREDTYKDLRKIFKRQ